MSTRFALVILCLVSFAFFVMAQDMQKTRASDFGLRGHVSKCTERTTYPAGPGTIEEHATNTISFALDGSVLEHSYQFGNAPAYSRVYDHRDPLTLSDKPAPPDRDASGRKIKIRQFPKYELRPDVAIGSIEWEHGDLTFTPPSEGSITTIYDDNNRPKQAEVRDATGQVILRIVREYDEKGRVKSDKIVSEQPDSTVLSQLSESPTMDELNDLQKRALVTFMSRAFHGGESTLKYDDHDRVIEKHVKRGGIQDELTRTTYNDQGDVSEETVIRTESPQMRGEFSIDNAGNIVPTSKPQPVPLPHATTTRYIYEYDSRGNWTKKTAEVRYEADQSFQPGSTTERTLTYY